MTKVLVEAKPGPEGADDAVPSVRVRRRTGLWLGASSLALVVGGPSVAWLISNAPYPAQGRLEPLMFAGILAVPVGVAMGVVTLIVNAVDRRTGGVTNSSRSGSWLGAVAILVGLGLIGFMVFLIILVLSYLAAGM